MEVDSSDSEEEESQVSEEEEDSSDEDEEAAGVWGCPSCGRLTTEKIVPSTGGGH